MKTLKFFTEIKRNAFFNYGRLKITPGLVNGLTEIALEILAK